MSIDSVMVVIDYDGTGKWSKDAIVEGIGSTLTASASRSFRTWCTLPTAQRCPWIPPGGVFAYRQAVGITPLILPNYSLHRTNEFVLTSGFVVYSIRF